MKPILSLEEFDKIGKEPAPQQAAGPSPILSLEDFDKVQAQPQQPQTPQQPAEPSAPSVSPILSLEDFDKTGGATPTAPVQPQTQTVAEGFLNSNTGGPEELLSPEARGRISVPQNDLNLSDDEAYAMTVEIAANELAGSGVAPTEAPIDRDAFIRYRDLLRQGAEPGTAVVQSPLDSLGLEAGPTVTIERSDNPIIDFGKQTGRSIQAALQEAGLGAIARTYADWADLGEDQLRNLYPNATDEQIEELQSELPGYIQRKIREANEQELSEDDTVPWLIGQIFTPDPVDLIPMMKAARGATAGSRIVERGLQGAALGGVSDAGYQASELNDGVIDEFSGERLMFSAATGAALIGTMQGAYEAGGAIRRGMQGPQFDEAPTTDGPAPDGPGFGEQGAPAFINQPVKQDAPQSPRVEELQGRVDEITSGWADGPEIKIVRNVDDLDDDLAASITAEGAESVEGLVTADGKVVILADNLESPADVDAVVYHEALGHLGLAREFGVGLDKVLDDLYRTNDWAQKTTDEWMIENPDAYGGNRLRAIEEVLAEASEYGPQAADIMDKLKYFFAQMGRKIGMDIEYSDAQVRALLRKSHERIISGGKGAGIVDGVRFMTAWHGSGADFNRFDHSYMSSGEGVQAFGWGSYFTDIRGIAEDYATRFGESSVSWKGVEGRWMDVRRNAEDAAQRRGFSPEEQTLVNDAITYHSTTRNPSKEEFQREWGLPKEEADKIWDFVSDGLKVKNTGKLYEVELQDDATWLEWELPIREQEAVRQALSDAGISVLSKKEYDDLKVEFGKLRKEYTDVNEKLKVAEQNGDEALADRLFEDLQTVATPYQQAKDRFYSAAHEGMEGETAYRLLAEKLKGGKAASEALASAGIYGNRFVANNIHKRKPRTGNDKYNYVIFDDAAPVIKNKYAKKGRKKEAVPQKKIERGKVTNVNLDKMISKRGDGVLDVIEQTGELSELDLTPESFADMDARARAMNMGVDEIRELNPGMDWAEAHAVGIALVRTAEKADRLSAMIDKGKATDEDQANFVQTLLEMDVIYEAYSRAANNAGRLLASFKLAKQASGGADIRFMAKSLRNTPLEDPDTIRAIAKQMQERPDQIGRIARDALKPGIEDLLNTIRYNAMLSHPATHVVNMLGTTSHFAASETARLFGAMVGKAIGADDRPMIREMGWRFKGVMHALYAMSKDVVHDAINALNKEASLKSDIIKAYRDGVPQHRVSKIEHNTTLLQNGTNSNTLKTASMVLEAPVRALAAEDEFFRNIILLSNHYGEAYRSAYQAGFRGQDLKDEVKRLINDPTEEMIQSANSYAELIQFVDDPKLRIPNRLDFEKMRTRQANDSKLMRVGKFGIRQAIPFVRTIDALLRAAFRYNAATMFLSRTNQAGWAAGGAQRLETVGRYMVATALTSFTMEMLLEDRLTGNGPRSPEKRRELESLVDENGKPAWQANSIKINGEWYSYKGMEPFSIIFNTMANVKEDYEEDGIDDPMGAGTTVVRSLLASMNDNTFTSGIADLFEAASEGPTGEYAFNNWMASYASSYVPGLVNYVNEDTQMRETSGDGSLADRVEGRVVGRAGSEDLPQRYDIFGRPMMRPKDNFGSVTRFKQPQAAPPTPAMAEISRLIQLMPMNKTLVSREDRGSLGKLPKPVDVADVMALQREVGQLAVLEMEMAMSSPEYATMADYERIELVQDIYKDARKTAKANLFPDWYGD